MEPGDAPPRARRFPVPPRGRPRPTRRIPAPMQAALAMQIVTAALGAMMLAIIWSLRRCGLPGVGHWFYANLAAALALVLFALRGRLPDGLVIGLGNPLLAWAMAQMYAGVQRFCGRAPPWRALVAGVLALAAAVALWHFHFDDFNVRVAIVSVFHAALCAACGWTLLRARLPGRAGGHYVTTAVFALFFAAAHALRGALSLQAALQGPPGASPPGMHILFLLLGALAVPALTMGAVLMVHDRLVHRLELIANTDFLTGVLSRKAFEDEATRQLARAARGDSAPALLLLDIDRFKAVNDNHGHAAGDEVLRAFTSMARDAVRPGDRIGRLGGEEFAVLLPATALEDALLVAERLRARAEAGRVDGSFGSLHYTISGGVAHWLPGESLARLTGRADAALYAAKLAGRNRMLASATPAAARPATARSAPAQPRTPQPH